MIFKSGNNEAYVYIVPESFNTELMLLILIPAETILENTVAPVISGSGANKVAGAPMAVSVWVASLYANIYPSLILNTNRA